eukprot:3914103-Karenia_brevis.AAC.1
MRLTRPQRAQILAAAGSQYAWKPLVTAIGVMYPTTNPRMTEQDKSYQTRQQQQQRKGAGRGVATGNRGYPNRKPHKSVNEADTQSL